jgi:CRISPR/Cas system-associated exonuclease Cas4 (RecB family)
MLTLSHSQVQLYKTCKYKWYLRYIEGWKTKSTDAMTRGTLMHEILAIYYSTGYDVDKTRRAMKEKFAEEPSNNRANNLALLERYISEFSPLFDKNQNTLYSELYFNTPFTSIEGNVFNIQGYIDRVYTKNNKVFVEDFKTLSNASWWTQDQLLLDSQLTLYAAILPTSQPDLPPVGGIAVTMLNTYEYKNNGMQSKLVSDLFKREIAYRGEAEKQSVLQEFGIVADEIITAINNPQKPFSMALNSACKFCEFSTACLYKLRGLDITPFLEESLERKPTELGNVYFTKKALL